MVAATKPCRVTKRMSVLGVAYSHPELHNAGSGIWRTDPGLFTLCVDYGQVTHCSQVDIRYAFFSNGRSGPAILNGIYPKSPFEDGSASLMHDLCAHSIGLTKRECDCAYGIILSQYIKPFLADAAIVTLDMLPNWFTSMDQIWTYNEPSMSISSKWCF